MAITQKELLQQARIRMGGVTNYKVGKALGITSAYMTQLTKNRALMSDELAFRLAELAGLPPEYVVASIEVERQLRYGAPGPEGSTNLRMAQMWHRIAQTFRGKGSEHFARGSVGVWSWKRYESRGRAALPRRRRGVAMYIK